MKPCFREFSIRNALGVNILYDTTSAKGTWTAYGYRNRLRKLNYQSGSF